MNNGSAGRILHVDLTSQTLRVEAPPEEFYRKYMGGSAMGLYYILQQMPAQADPLGPDNVLTVMLSPLVGAHISGQSRMTMNARSPLVDGVADAEAGGFFPAEMKFAGFDGIVVRGQARSPVYLWLHAGQAELRDAAHLTGRTTSEVERILKQELGDDRIEIAQCGPAGERLARLAAVINMANRANGRTGLGAVMGAKRLRAIVVRGRPRRMAVADAARLRELARAGAQRLRDNPDVWAFHEHGTASVVRSQQARGTLPHRNYSEGQFFYADRISGERLTATILARRDTCFACAVRCKPVVQTSWQGQAVEPLHGGPEYETIAMLGSSCGVSDLDAIAYANKLCNEYGLDTIGTGATIAWAMECFALGILTAEEVGYPLHFGDAAAMVRTVEQIGTRTGFGDVLADGSSRAAERLGKGHECLTTVKRGELPGHMPQANASLGVIYAVSPFGPDHQSSEYDHRIERGASELALGRLKLLGFDRALEPGSLDEEKVRFALQTNYFYSFLDSACLCQFVFGPAWSLYGPAETVEAVAAVTGWRDFDLAELLAIGARRVNMLRLVNQRLGLDRTSDRLPAKVFLPLRGTGPTAGKAVLQAQWEAAMETYYRLAGWDVGTGNPTRQRLRELGLEWAAP